MALTDIVGYTFRAAIYCPEHVLAAMTATPEFEGWELADGVDMSVEDNLTEVAVAFGIDRDKEYTFDADEFPKRIFGWEADGSETCDADGEPLE